jgi:hypothetical protein
MNFYAFKNNNLKREMEIFMEGFKKKNFHKLLVFHSLWKLLIFANQPGVKKIFFVVSTSNKSCEMSCLVSVFRFFVIIAFYGIDGDIGLLVLDHHRFLQHSSGILVLLVLRHHRF